MKHHWRSELTPGPQGPKSTLDLIIDSVGNKRFPIRPDSNQQPRSCCCGPPQTTQVKYDIVKYQHSLSDCSAPESLWRHWLLQEAVFDSDVSEQEWPSAGHTKGPPSSQNRTSNPRIPPMVPPQPSTPPAEPPDMWLMTSDITCARLMWTMLIHPNAQYCDLYKYLLLFLYVQQPFAGCSHGNTGCFSTRYFRIQAQLKAPTSSYQGYVIKHQTRRPSRFLKQCRKQARLNSLL